jgi:hypothetical protein
MNFEEMLNAQEGLAPKREKLPFGDFYRKQIDGKYRFVVELKSGLTDSIVFCEALKKEHQWSLKQRSKQQLHYELHEDSGGLYELGLETGNYQTLSQLVFDNPAVVAQKGFVDQMVNSLIDYTSKLHSEGIYHICFAPQNVFLRKGDQMPMLLCHGSFYTSLNDLDALYKDVEGFVAPEVFSHGTIDERSDVYSVGKLISYLYEQGSMPFEYKQVVQKATEEDPARRYKSLEDMKGALAQKRNTLRSVYALVAAVVIALICVGVYFEMLPEAGQIDYVEPVPTVQEADPFDDHFDPALLMEEEDSIGPETDAMYQQKAEEIFRKHYQREADRILSKIYDNERMGSSEKAFMANTQSMAEELLNTQKKLAEEMGIDESTAGKLGHEIVEELTKQKQQALDRKGYIKPKEDGEEKE